MSAADRVAIALVANALAVGLSDAAVAATRARYPDGGPESIAFAQGAAFVLEGLTERSIMVLDAPEKASVRA